MNQEWAIILILVFILYKFWSAIKYLNFKIQVLQRILITSGDGDKLNDAVDYVLENDYDHKATIFFLRPFTKKNLLDTVEGLKIDFESANSRFKEKFKE